MAIFKFKDREVEFNQSKTVTFVKFNPYHDKLGRFTSAGAAASFTIRTKDSDKQYLADKTQQRLKQKYEEEQKNSLSTKYGLSQEQAEELANSSLFNFGRKVKELGWDDETRNKFKEEFHVDQRRKESRESKAKEERVAQEKERAELDERVKRELPGLNQDAIRNANNASFFNHGSVAARDALRRVDEYKARNKITDDMNDEQKKYMKQRESEYKQLITEYYNDSNSRFANNPSWMVTGPARYNTARSEKLNRAAERKAQDYEDKLARFEENTQKRLKSLASEEQQIARWRQGKWNYGEKIDAADPLAEKKYQAKIDYLREYNEKSKAANEYWNKNHTMTGFEGFSEKNNQQLNEQFQRIYSGVMQRDGNLNRVRSPFSTTNNATEIRRAESQLKQIQQRKQTANSSGYSFNGGKIVRNISNNRLQIKFDSIPDVAIRQQLKSNGFRWSPKEQAWQRQLTDNAERAAQKLFGNVQKELSAQKEQVIFRKDDKTKISFVKFNPYHDRLGRFTTGRGAASVSFPKNMKAFSNVDRYGDNSSISKYIDSETGKISKERMAVYNQIVNDMMKGIKAPEGTPEIHFMGGGGGSGKSYTIANGTVKAPDSKHAVHINADDIKLKFDDFKKIAGNSNESVAKTAANYVHEESSIVTKLVTKVAMDRGLNVVIDGVGQNPAKQKKIVDDAKRKGYKVEAHYINAPTKIALEANEGRFYHSKNMEQRRYVPPEVIKSAHKAVSKNFNELFKVYDKIEVIQNDRKNPVKRIAFKNDDGKLIVLDEKLFKQFLQKQYE